MRIATFNLESLDLPPRDPRPIETRIAMLGPELARASADILCLQEVNAQHVPGRPERELLALERLLEGTPYESYAMTATHSPSGKGFNDVHNLVTLSRFPVLSSRTLRHVLVPPHAYRHLTAVPPADGPVALEFDRAILETTLDIGEERPLTVFNCHLRAPLASSIPGQKRAPFVWETVSGWAEGFCISAMKRNFQALELRLAVDELLARDPSALVLLAGDFNAEDYEAALRILVGAEQDTGNGELAPAALVVLDRALPADRRFSVVHQGRPQMLDHMLATRPLYARFRTISAYNEALADEAVGYARVDRPSGSYHACLVAEFG